MPPCMGTAVNVGMQIGDSKLSDRDAGTTTTYKIREITLEWVVRSACAR